MAQRADPADLLARTPLFGGLDEPSRKAVATEMREAAYEPGQVIFSRGDAGSDLHVVTKGRVRLSVLTSDGRELSFAHAEAPSIFGELAVFDGRPWEVFTRLFADATSAGATDPADAIHYVELVLRLPARIAALTAGVDADIRLPFVDHRLAQFVTGLIPQERTDRRFGCPALREALRGLLPDAVCRAGHENTLRAAVWASPAFRTYCRETLSAERLGAQGVFRSDAIEQLWKEHDAGVADHGARLWSLVLATRWLAHPEIRLSLDSEPATIVSRGDDDARQTGSDG